MRIKICGLKRIEDVGYVNAAHPDFAGFVFAGTKRKIDFDMAKQLKAELLPSILSVGVFVNEDINFIAKLVAEDIIDVIQLHGDEDDLYIEALRKTLDNTKKITIIKAIRVKSQSQVKEAEKMDVDFLLLDAFTEDEYGGSGKVFNHEFIPRLAKPYFLAGGITAENVTAVLTALKRKNNLPYCIDVSSSVETEGVKDETKILELVKLVQHI